MAPVPAQDPEASATASPSDDDFRQLVSDDALTRLDAADVSGVRFTDIWLTHAFQGGRISETLSGCVWATSDREPSPPPV